MSTLQLVAPFLGAALLELVHWYQLREKFEDPKFQKVLRSVAYWVITLAMIVGGGLGALVLYDGSPAASLLLAGAAFPTVFKKLVAAFAAKSVNLGAERDVVRPSVVDYFSVA